MPSEAAEAYHEYLQRTGLAEYRAAPGCEGASVLRRTEGEVTDFVLLTLWNSWEAIRAFAGDDPARARYYPEDETYLLEREPRVTHYEVYPEEG